MTELDRAIEAAQRLVDRILFIALIITRRSAWRRGSAGPQMAWRCGACAASAPTTRRIAGSPVPSLLAFIGPLLWFSRGNWRRRQVPVHLGVDEEIFAVSGQIPGFQSGTSRQLSALAVMAVEDRRAADLCRRNDQYVGLENRSRDLLTRRESAIVLPKFGSHRRSSNVERRAEEPLSKNGNKLTVFPGINRTEKFGDCHCGDDHLFLLFVQIAEKDSGSPLHLGIVIAQGSLLRIDLAKSPDQHHRVECDAHLSPATSFR